MFFSSRLIILVIPHGLGAMEVVAGAASISQLVAYSFSSIRYLRQLHAELTSDNSVYHNEERNISLLLGVLNRLTTQSITHSDSVLPILIDISGIACDLLNLLRPKRLLGYNWTTLTARDRTTAAFEALDRKQNLLHLYISQANNDALAAIYETMNQDTQHTPTQATYVRATVSVKNNNVEGYSETGSGYESEVQPNVEDHGNNVPAGGTLFSGNKTQNEQATILALQGRQAEIASQKTAAANSQTQAASASAASAALAPQAQSHNPSESRSSRPNTTARR